LKDPFLSYFNAPVTLGAWIALVGTAVKAAFSSKTSGKAGSKTALHYALNALCLAGPYIFALGLLVFVPVVIRPIFGNRLCADRYEAGFGYRSFTPIPQYQRASFFLEAFGNFCNCILYCPNFFVETWRK
jgi:hypothetical protein